MDRLEIRIDTAVPNYPKVLLLIDGTELLASLGSDERNDPADLLDSGALLPTDPPRRVAFYGCGCGEFGCANVAGLVRQSGRHVEWTDFCSLTGVYTGALADPAYGPDPADSLDEDVPPVRLDLPTLTFNAHEYFAVVEAAMNDRSWETRPRAVVRHMRALRPETTHWAVRDGDAITIHHRVDGKGWSTDLLVPPGPPDELAEKLLATLDQGFDPQRIASKRLWR